MERYTAIETGCGPLARHAEAHLRRRGLQLLAACPLEHGESVLLARDQATGGLVLARVSGLSGGAGAPVRLDRILVTLDGAGALGRLDHREGPVLES